jgi:tetratricopeptide (TPR) repeat protein/DNA-binding CsgD family transcriptional regulator
MSIFISLHGRTPSYITIIIRSMTTPAISELRAALDAATTDADRLVAMQELAFGLHGTDPEEALLLASTSREIATRLGDETRRARGWHIAGMAHSHQGNYHEAQREVSQACELYEELGDMALLARTTGTLANLYAESGDPLKAIKSYHSVLALFEQLGDRPGSAMVTGNIGSVYARLGEYARALEYLQSALVLFRQLGDERNAIRLTGHIGHIHNYLGDYDRAFEQLHATLEMHRSLGDAEGMAHMRTGIARVHFERGEHRQAVDQYQSAVEMFEQVGAHSLAAMARADMGSCYTSLGEYARALGELQSALAVYEQIGSRKGIGHATGRLGELYSTAEFDGYDPDRAEELLLQGIDHATEGGWKELVVEFHQSIARHYEQQGKWKESHHHLRKYYELHEELQNLEAHRKAQQFEHQKQIAEIEKQRAVEQAQMEIQRMKAEQIEKDLGNATLQLLAQTELLSDLRHDLLKIARKIPPTDPGARELRERVKNLPCQSVDWEKFDRQFRSVHPEFIQRLTERAPDLTMTELRICTMLRMNLKSSEMAQIFCITESGVEFHRKHIRKKLKLGREEKLPIVLGGM